MRPISIPRLELQAPTLSVKMYRVPVDELTCKIKQGYILVGFSDDVTVY